MKYIIPQDLCGIDPCFMSPKVPLSPWTVWIVILLSVPWGKMCLVACAVFCILCIFFPNINNYSLFFRFLMKSQRYILMSYYWWCLFKATVLHIVYLCLVFDINRLVFACIYSTPCNVWEGNSSSTPTFSAWFVVLPYWNVGGCNMSS